MTAIDTTAPSTFRLTRTTAVLAAVGASLLINLLLWLAGLAAGGDFTMTDGAGVRAPVAPGGVAVLGTWFIGTWFIGTWFIGTTS